MPKSSVSKTRMFRDVSFMNKRHINNNYLKNLRSAISEFLKKNKELSRKDIYFMLYVYDLEFFTISRAAENYDMTRGNLSDRIIYPLVNLGYLYKHFDKLSPSQTMEDHLFRDETKYNYRVRYALSQKGRMAVQRFYSYL